MEQFLTNKTAVNMGKSGKLDTLNFRLRIRIVTKGDYYLRHVCPSVHLSIRLHVSAWLPLESTL
jgi:hypothetical protein